MRPQPIAGDLRKPASHRGARLLWRAAKSIVLSTSAAIAMFALTSAAAAQTTAVAGGSPNKITIALPVTSSVAARCTFASGAAPSGAYTVPNIDDGFSHDFSFSLDCNLPLRVAVVSANGALVAPTGPLPPGYSSRAPYNVTLNIVGNALGVSANASCESQSLAASASTPCSFRGPASTSAGLKLTGAADRGDASSLRVSAAAYAQSETLVASSAYTDTLTVSVSASP
jgi:hypothetical protein